jgi:RHS repeat-associated protein
VTGPATGATTTYTYDGYGRADTVTDSDGYELDYDYDALDRKTKVTYPDTTFEERVFDRLDALRTRDRLGRWNHYVYDAVQRVTAASDPLGRTATRQWCSCGSLEALIDANGNRTEWERDIQGRVTKEIRADGSEWLYEYEETTSRVKEISDPKEQVKTYSYFLDNNLQGVSYTNEEHETPNLSFTYETAYDRVATMVDGTGTTTYDYNPTGASPSLGAARLATVDGPLSNDTIRYGYDELGRAVSRAINGVALTFEYDALGRVVTENNVLGTFSYQYDDVTTRFEKVTSPNGQTSTYAFYSSTGDHRLQEIHNKKSDGSTISKFNYTYDVIGNIKTWTQQEDTNQAKAYDFEYDRADQLRTAVWRTTDVTPTILKRYTYQYDPAGNRTVEQIDNTPVLSAYDNMNRLSSQIPGGTMRFVGTLSEAATVTIQGAPVTATSDNRFAGGVQVGSGTTQVVVKAKDYAGNERTNTYEVSVSGSSKTFTFDANGNMTGDGTRTFEWDAENRLIAINQSTLRSEFTYDGLQRRVRMVEKAGGVVQSDRQVIWCETVICEERDADGVTVLRRAFAQGEQVSGVTRFFMIDHLGSVREVTDVTSAVQARYALDPWGRRTVTSGSDITSVGFTGHRWQAMGGLWLTLHRGYDPDLARWIGEDPIGLNGGLNLYGYVNAQPTQSWDPFGLQGVSSGGPSGGGGGGGGCCCDLEKRRKRLHDILDYYESGKEITFAGSYAVSGCSVNNGVFTGNFSVFPDTPPCLVECVTAHEERHVQQCRRFGPSFMGTAASERGGNMVELGCVIETMNKLGCRT